MLKKSYVSFFFALIILCSVNSSFLFAQDNQPSISQKAETRSVPQSSIVNHQSTILPHSPRKATIMSAILPGLGQAYNKKYWKIPVIYAGFAVCAYFITDNQKMYQAYSDLYKASVDTSLKNYFFQGKIYNYSDLHSHSEDIRGVVETYHKWRDLSVILTTSVYLLNIIDANVDGHLFNFDISDDLSINVLPYFYLSQNNNYSGISLKLRL